MPRGSSHEALSPSPNAEYRYNYDRSINVFGSIDDDLVKRLTPEILRLRSGGSKQPITVFIDSPGGSIEAYKHLEGLLFDPDQEGNTCRILTVATSYAASAAARLLVRGDYSMAFKKATVHCHGVRYQSVSILTKERAESMSESLAGFNEEMAGDFLQKIIENLCWLYSFNRKRFEEDGSQNPGGNRVSFLPILIGDHLSPHNTGIVDTTVDELNQVSELEKFLKAKTRQRKLRAAETRGRAARDAELMKAIVDFVGSTRQQDEKKDGLTKTSIAEIFFLYSQRRSYYEKFLSDCDDPDPLLVLLCDQKTLTEFNAIKGAAERSTYLGNSTGASLFNCWQLSSTIASRLVKGENALTATDAYWLGLVNEVIGDETLLNRRMFAEMAA